MSDGSNVGKTRSVAEPRTNARLHKRQAFPEIAQGVGAVCDSGHSGRDRLCQGRHERHSVGGDGRQLLGAQLGCSAKGAVCAHTAAVLSSRAWPIRTASTTDAMFSRREASQIFCIFSADFSPTDPTVLPYMYTCATASTTAGGQARSSSDTARWDERGGEATAGRGRARQGGAARLDRDVGDSAVWVPMKRPRCGELAAVGRLTRDDGQELELALVRAEFLRDDKPIRTTRVARLSFC